MATKPKQRLFEVLKSQKTSRFQAILPLNLPRFFHSPGMEEKRNTAGFSLHKF
jgi:hypothetical protein